VEIRSPCCRHVRASETRTESWPTVRVRVTQDLAPFSDPTTFDSFMPIAAPTAAFSVLGQGGNVGSGT
jgi:hypothetical protein